MTDVEKNRCAEVFKTVSGKETDPARWNDAAGDLLAEMVAKIRECSNAMDFVPRPAGWRPGWSYIVNYAYQALKTRYVRAGGSYELCVIGASSYVSLIEAELQ